MALTQTKTPYEFLARWTDDGSALKGAHIAFIETIKDGATVLSVKVGDAQPVSLAGEQGFPLAQALAALNAAAIADGEAKAAQIAALAAAANDAAATHAAALLEAGAAHAAVTAERDAALAQVGALTEQLAALQHPVVNGVPQAVDMVKFVVYAQRQGFLATVESAVAAAGPEAALIWQRSKTVQRRNTLMLTLAHNVFHWTDAEIDAHFVAADQVVI